MLLKQGSKMVEEFFQEFDQLKFAAGYTDRYHDDILTKLLHNTIRTHIIDHIYTQSPLPANY
jgi:flagellar motor switch protein FliG